MLNLRFILGCFVLFLSLYQVPAYADIADLKQQISDTKAGQLTSSELADYLIDAVFIAEIDIDEVEAKQFLGIAGFDEVLGQKIYIRSTELFLETLSITDDLNKLKVLSGKILPEDAVDSRKVSRLFTQVSKAQNIIQESKYTASDKFFESIVIEEEKKFFSLFLADAWGKRAEEFAIKGETLNALKSYSRGAQGVGAKNYLNVATPLVDALSASNIEIQDTELAKFLFELGRADQNAGRKVAAYFSVLILKALDENKIEKAKSLYEKVLTVRPDPNSQNKELRKGIASRAKNYETRLFALGRIEEMKSQGELDFNTKFFLFKHGMYWSGLKKWLFVLVCLALIAALTFNVTQKIFAKSAIDAEKRREKKAKNSLVDESEKKASKSKGSKRADSASMNFPKGASVASKAALEQARMREEARAAFAGENEEKKGFSLFGKKKQKGYEKIAAGTDEYGKLLAVFELTDEADEKQIKKAFRQKLKEYHPDITELDVEEAQQKTDELKLIYDRILEIRGSWFGKG